jgi:Ca2+-binding EF-hand superfamily protein
LKDVNKNGLVQYTEFLAASLEAHSMIEEERIAEAFDRLDNDNTGYISKANLINFLGADKSATEVEQLLNEADSNKDGKSKCMECPEKYINLPWPHFKIVVSGHYSFIQGVHCNLQKEDTFYQTRDL